MNWLTNIFGGLGQAAQGAGRSIAGAGNSLMGMFSGAGNTLAQGASQLGQGIGQNLAQNLGQTLGRTSQQAPAVSSPMGSSAQKLSLPSMGSAPMSPGLGMTGGATSPTESPIKKAQSNGWWNQLTQGINVPQTLLGMGVNAVGNMTAP